jgi:hypothetical protein
MRTYKTEILSHKNFVTMYVGIEYDSKSDLTSTVCKIVGKTIVYRNPNKGWNTPVQGNQENSLIKKYTDDKAFKTCSIDEFNKFKIGEKPPKK